MKSKLNFFGVCALTCALVLSLFSCTKDLQDQIDKLTTDVAALQSAINSGKLVKSVNPVAGGYDIVFSDNSTIRINHGTNGTPGTPGTPGAPGAAGFTPIIGIDADGYWTVVASQGATPVRIKNASGNEVKASMSDNLTLVDNYLAVNGTKTTIYIPNIAYNAVTRTLMIWAKNEDGTSTMYNVPLADEIVLTTDIVGLVSPIGHTKIILQYGAVPKSTDAIKPSAAALTFAGVSYGQSLGSDAAIPVIVNPSAAAIAGYTFEIIKTDGTPYAFQGTIEPGFDITKKFSQYTAPAAGGSNALYSIKLNPSLAQITAHLGKLKSKETNELAVRATKAGREIVSGYQYSINVKKADEQVTTPLFAEYYLPTGTSVDAMNLLTSDSLFTTIPSNDWNTTFVDYDSQKLQSASNFYKVGVSYSTTLTTSEDIKPYITINPANSIITTAVGHHSVANLNERVAYFRLKTFDYTGNYEDQAIKVNYFTDLTATIPDAAAISHTIKEDDSTTTVDEEIVTINLDPMFTALDAAGKTALWRAHAKDMLLSTKVGGDTYSGNDPVAAKSLFDLGIEYSFLTITGTDATGPEDIRKIEFRFNPEKTVPGTYNLKFTFKDRRIGVSIPQNQADPFGTFTFNIPITFANPSALPSNVTALLTHTAGLWTGNNLSVFGNNTSVTGQIANSSRYDLAGAYSASLNTEIVNCRAKFITTSTADNAAGLITGSRNYLVQRQTDPPTANPYTTLYTPKTVKLRYYWFGNADNYVDLETITVTAKSQIKEGKLVNVLNTLENGTHVTNGSGVTHTPLTVTHGVAGAKNLAEYFKFTDYFNNDLTVFETHHESVAAVELVLDAQYDNLLTVTGTTVESKTTSITPISGDVVVPIKVRVQDIFGLWFEGTVNVTVKKP